MNKICTTIEQSQKLIELGVGADTADMCYLKENGQPKAISPLKLSEILDISKPQVIPAWSLSALLGLMPKDESKTISLCLGGSNGIEHTFDWFCTCDENDEPYDYKTFHTSSPIDCTFEMLCWLKENNKI